MRHNFYTSCSLVRCYSLIARAQPRECEAVNNRMYLRGEVKCLNDQIKLICYTRPKQIGLIYSHTFFLIWIIWAKPQRWCFGSPAVRHTFVCDELKQLHADWWHISSLTLFSTITASCSLSVRLNISASSASRIVNSSCAFSPTSGSVAVRRPTSTPGAASSDTEKDHAPAERKTVSIIIVSTSPTRWCLHFASNHSYY